MWETWIHSTRSGAPELMLKTGRPVASVRATSTLDSKGSASHSLMLHDSGLPKTLIREIARGNKYTIVQRWGDHVAYAGVIRNRRFADSGSVLTIGSVELRGGLLGTRYPYGVNEYNPASGALNVSGRSRGAALRAVLLAATKGNAVSGWELPIDLPDDASGPFSASWRHEEKLSVEDMLRQIEADGVEIAFRPYLTSAGALRYEARCQVEVAAGAPFPLAARAPGSIVMGLSVEDDYVGQRTGILGFGKGRGQDTPHTFAPLTGNGIGDLPVMDSDEAFPDISNPTRLQDATNALFARKNVPTTQWDYSLFIGGVGPAVAAPAAIHDLHVFGSDFIPDGMHPQRVVSVSMDLSHVMKPGVQAYGG